ncbi:MAG: permease [Jhaorihella sp.]
MADASRTAPGGRRVGMAALKTPWVASLAILLAVGLLDPGSFPATVAFAARALAATAPYILFAVLLLAWLKAAGADSMVARAFEGRETRMIVMAALIGGLAPFCSCQVIPFIAGLLALGAPLSAVMAFWLSSPLIDPPTLLIAAGALGWPFAIAKALAAVGLGLFGGFAVRGLVRGGAFAEPLRQYRAAGCGCGPKPDGKPHWRFWTEAPRRSTFRAELVDNGLFLLKWLALAYVLEALLVRYVPAGLIASVVGGTGFGAIVTAAVVGMPAYLNGYVAPPLLAGLVGQGMSPGAAMAFIVAGSVSSIPAMAAVWSLVKPRVFAVYLGLGLSGAVVAGLLFQAVS